MTIKPALLLSFSLAAMVSVSAGDASACGGYFAESTVTPVVGHSMILSISKTSSTLWDQVDYSGDPASFAWVLPIKGTVEVGVSTDALFQVLEQQTQVVIRTAEGFCPSDYEGGGVSGAGGGEGNGGIAIHDQHVVGPYETVQLSAADPEALTMWLVSHGYAIPANIQPIIDDYVADGFGFLALKLVPGKGVSSMRPVRVTTPGASPVLPLRMVAAGTGAITPIQLWIAGDGRYEPQNFPSLTIAEEDVVWDWDTYSSNYAALREQGYVDSGNQGWLTDFAERVDPLDLRKPLEEQALEQYADADGMDAETNLAADLAALYGGLDSNDTWITHLSAKLSQAALENDLLLQASSPQTFVSGDVEPGKELGDPCLDGGSCVCGVPQGRVASDLAGLGALAAAAVGVARRRRRKPQGARTR